MSVPSWWRLVLPFQHLGTRHNSNCRQMKWTSSGLSLDLAPLIVHSLSDKLIRRLEKSGSDGN